MPLRKHIVDGFMDAEVREEVHRRRKGGMLTLNACRMMELTRS
jgi:hypothetical protein